MLPLNATLSHCNGIGCNPTIAPNIRALRPRGPALGMIVRFMQSLLQALHESRLEHAKREISSRPPSHADAGREDRGTTP